VGYDPQGQHGALCTRFVRWRARRNGIVSDSGMAIMFGGGLDVWKKRFAVRAVQFDWMVLRFAGVSDKNNFRLNAGLMCRFWHERSRS